MNDGDYVTIQERIPIQQAPVILDETAEITAGTWAGLIRSTEVWWQSQRWHNEPPATLTWESVPLVMDRNAAANRIYYSNTQPGYIQWTPSNLNLDDLDWDNPWANPRPHGWSKEDWECMKVSSGL